MFTLEEVSQMLNMTREEVESEIINGYLGYNYDNGEKKVTLYDLEKYMGEEQTSKITREFLQRQES